MGRAAKPTSKYYNKENFTKASLIRHPDGDWDYSEVECSSSSSRVILNCKKCGYRVTRIATAHLGKNACGCRRCSDAKKSYTTESFARKGFELYQDAYTYEKVVYVSSLEKVIINCKIHGYFEQRPDMFLQNHGCGQCGHARGGDALRKTTGQFVLEADQVHDGKYSYEKVVYTSKNDKVIITCKIHGDFEQTPDSHLGGHGCFDCGYLGVSKHNSRQAGTFIPDAIKVHGDIYCYKKTRYAGTNKKVIITCKKHGDFKQTPNSHLRKSGCKDCGIERMVKIQAKDANTFKSQGNKVHNNRYGYHKVKYVNCKTKVIIVCPEHGDFEQTPNAHVISKSGCRFCRVPKLEVLARKVLKECGIEYIEQPTFKELGRKRLDFYLPDNNILIEMDGIQHTKFCKFFHKTQKGWEKQQATDKLKTDFAKDNGYILIRVLYNAKPSPEIELRKQLEKYGIKPKGTKAKKSKKLASPLPQAQMYQTSLF